LFPDRCFCFGRSMRFFSLWGSLTNSILERFMTRFQKGHGASVARYFLRAKSSLPYLFRTLGLVWRAAPGWTAAWVALLVAQGFLPVAIVYLTRPLVNGITAAV